MPTPFDEDSFYFHCTILDSLSKCQAIQLKNGVEIETEISRQKNLKWLKDFKQFLILSHWGNAKQNDSEILYYSIQNSKIKYTNDLFCWRGCRMKETHLHCW